MKLLQKKTKNLPENCNFSLDFWEFFENISDIRGGAPHPDPLHLDTHYKPTPGGHRLPLENIHPDPTTLCRDAQNLQVL